MSEEEQQKELIMKFQVMEQQIQQLQQQLQAVERAIVEIGSINFGLDELVGKKDKEILAPVGKGIFVKAKLLSEELTVDVGGKNFVKKSIPDTKKIIETQIKKLEDIKKELQENMDQLGQELTNIYMDAQKKMKK